MCVRLETTEAIATIVLNDPQRRNALSLPMFDALDDALMRVAQDASVRVLLLRGEGSAFCAGFDLAAAVSDQSVLATFIHRLSILLRNLRRIPQIVVAAVHGAAVAGGCAILSACDFVFVAADATLGYPVHAMGVSPAVTIPTLRQTLGDGTTRALLMSGELIKGREAFRRKLASHLVQENNPVLHDAFEFCRLLAAKPPYAVRRTKAWLNQLDGSLEDQAFEDVARNSATLAHDPDSVALLHDFWSKRKHA